MLNHEKIQLCPVFLITDVQMKKSVLYNEQKLQKNVKMSQSENDTSFAPNGKHHV
jgi:hypothetical protein